MPIYTIVFVILSFFAFPKDYRRLFYPVLFFLFVFSGWRGMGVDRDYLNYIDLITLSAANLSYPIEPAFKIISFVSINILGSYLFVFVIFSAVSLYFKAKTIKQLSPLPMLSLLVLYSNVFLLHDLTQIRVAAAGAIGCYGFIFLINNETKKFSIYVLIASLFHYSALAFLIAMVFNRQKVTMYFCVSYVSLLMICYIFYYININPVNLLQYINIPYLQSKYSDYSQQISSPDYVKVNVYSFVQLSHVAISLFLLMSSYKIKLNPSMILMLKIYSMAPLLLVALSAIPAFSLRMSELFSIVEIILLPLLVNAVKQKLAMKLAVVIIAALMFYINIYHVQLLNGYYTSL